MELFMLAKKNLFLSKLLGANLQIFSVQNFKSSSCRIIFRDKPQIFVNVSGRRLLQRGPGIPSIALGHQGILKQGRKLLACQKCVDMLMGQWWQPQQNWVIIFAFAVFRMTPRFESWLQVCVRCKHLCIYHILFMIQTLLKKTNKHKTTTKALSWAGVLVVGWCAVRVFACLFLEREKGRPLEKRTVVTGACKRLCEECQKWDKPCVRSPIASRCSQPSVWGIVSCLVVSVDAATAQ